ncbi:helix-turn-helix domain-containing protein [Chitinophagaceae bacterium MMS25-I14]
MEKKKAATFEEFVEKKYGQPGTASRNAFEEKAQMFLIAEMLRDARLEAGLTQQQLAEKVGTKKTYISRLENGKGDIQLSTLFRIFEEGLGRRVNIFIE